MRIVIRFNNGNVYVGDVLAVEFVTGEEPGLLVWPHHDLSLWFPRKGIASVYGDQDFVRAFHATKQAAKQKVKEARHDAV